jgi:chorismate-pyruvate lyase
MSFSYTLTDKWHRADSLIKEDAGKGLSDKERMILLSDGSLTLQLEALLNSRVSVEVKLSAATGLSSSSAAYLGEEPGIDSIEREVWLMVKDERLVFAHLVIPVSCIEPWLLTALKEGAEPLGRVLQSREIPVLKEALEIGVVTAPEVSVDLGLTPETRLFARRYRLTNKKDGGGWTIKAEICEILNPALVSPANP